jgi:hypothetical protein
MSTLTSAGTEVLCIVLHVGIPGPSTGSHHSIQFQIPDTLNFSPHVSKDNLLRGQTLELDLRQRKEMPHETLISVGFLHVAALFTPC